MDEGFEERIRDIRRRIEEQRAQLGYTQARSNPTLRNDSIPQQTSDVDKPKETRKKELDDIKAKLMGGKK